MSGCLVLYNTQSCAPTQGGYDLHFYHLQRAVMHMYSGTILDCSCMQCLHFKLLDVSVNKTGMLFSKEKG